MINVWPIFYALSPGIPRHGYEVIAADSDLNIGTVTSGNISPVLQAGIGYAYLDASQTAIDQPVRIKARQKLINAKIVKPPFVTIKNRYWNNSNFKRK